MVTGILGGLGGGRSKIRVDVSSFKFHVVFVFENVFFLYYSPFH